MKVPQNTAETKSKQNEKRTPDFMNGPINFTYWPYFEK